MARKALNLRPPSSYELLVRRIERQLLQPRVQLQRMAIIERQADELREDWAALIEHLEQQVELRMESLEGGAVRLSWAMPTHGQ